MITTAGQKKMHKIEELDDLTVDKLIRSDKFSLGISAEAKEVAEAFDVSDDDIKSDILDWFFLEISHEDEVITRRLVGLNSGLNGRFWITSHVESVNMSCRIVKTKSGSFIKLSVTPS